MIVVPVYDMLLFPEVNFYFKRDVYEKWKLDRLEDGEAVMFVLLKEQKDIEETTAEDYLSYGFTAKIINPNVNDLVHMRVINRVDVDDIEQEHGELTATGTVRPLQQDISIAEKGSMFSALKADYLSFISGFDWGIWVRSTVNSWNSMEEMLCSSVPYMTMSRDEKCELMEIDSMRELYEKIDEKLRIFFEETKIKTEAQSAQQESHEQAYREMALKKQLSYLQGQVDALHPENETDIAKYERLIAESGMNETACKEAEKVLKRLKQEGKEGHEYGLLCDYLDFVTALCWKKMEMKPVDLGEVQKVLDEDHYGLKKVKDRVAEQMAVMALTKKQSGSILLFAGPPGTGKTSIGASIAKALGREYVRVSLGGIRDEAEIRGHRRTYVGAMPGRIMEGIKRSKASNPVMVLDEVDKLTKDMAGDPSSALLEVLDPEQNSSFTDHYMNVPYDLSDVLFICTANNLEAIPEPLRNRMELINFSGYTADEKFHIAKQHLLPQVMQATGIKSSQLKVSDKALQKIIADYTAESGVRTLKRTLETLCRKTAVKLAEGEKGKVSVGIKKLEGFLGDPILKHDVKLEKAQPGVATGMAWTSAGGEILFIECCLMKGSGKLMITGQLGDVMKESVQIAQSIVRKNYPEESSVFETSDLHVHVPAGAVPKDGPSAGVTITTALVSALTGKCVDTNLAMTGEVSLRGAVLPIGGLPEKLMAAVRAGITRVILPEANRKDLKEIPAQITDQLEITFVKYVQEVLEQAFIA